MNKLPIKILGYVGGITSTIILLLKLIESISNGFVLKVTSTNTYNECYPEIVLLLIFLICLIYVVIDNLVVSNVNSKSKRGK